MPATDPTDLQTSSGNLVIPLFRLTQCPLQHAHLLLVNPTHPFQCLDKFWSTPPRTRNVPVIRITVIDRLQQVYSAMDADQ